MAPCVFCEIVAGRSPASPVWQDELVLAMMDIQPITTGHVLVIPRAHARDLTDLPPETGARMFQVGQQVARALLAGVADLRCEGVNLFMAHGSAAGQDVFHAHLHVIPRYVGDPFRVQVQGPWLRAPRAALDDLAASIARQLAARPPLAEEALCP